MIFRTFFEGGGVPKNVRLICTIRVYISFRKIKEPFCHVGYAVGYAIGYAVGYAFQGLTSGYRVPAKKLKRFSTVRARLAQGWLGHSTCKTSPFLA